MAEAVARKNFFLDLSLLGLILVVLASLTLLAPPIGSHGEAREGLVIQEIVASSNWILPYRNGKLPSKPPLFHWMAAGLEPLFGLSDATIRLPSAIAGWLFALVTFLLGREIGGRRTAWLAIGALLGTYEFWAAGTEARVDMVFAASVAASIAGFFFWYRSPDGFGSTLCYLAAASAVLAKGPAGIALPAAVAVGFLAAERRLDALRRFWSWPLAGSVLLIVLGWYALSTEIGGTEFLVKQILRENINRFFGTGGFSTQRERFAMAGWFATRLFPWNLVLIWALVRRLRGEREDSSGRFLHAWWIAIFAIFALSAGRRAVYLLPAYPAVALLAGRAIAAAIEGPRAARNPPGEREGGLFFRWRVGPDAAMRLIIATVILDVGQVVANPVIRAYQHREERTAQVSFAEEVRAAVPRGASLFADSSFPETNLLVTSYRLRREIGRRPMGCTGQDYYFLSVIGPENPPQEAYEVLAAMESGRGSLVLMLVPQEMVCGR